MSLIAAPIPAWSLWSLVTALEYAQKLVVAS